MLQAYQYPIFDPDGKEYCYYQILEESKEAADATIRALCIESLSGVYPGTVKVVYSADPCPFCKSTADKIECYHCPEFRPDRTPATLKHRKDTSLISHLCHSCCLEIGVCD